MKAFICIVLSLAIGYSSFSQNTYCITYKDFGSSDEKVVGNIGSYQIHFKKVEYLLAFNDTVAISFFAISPNTKSFQKYFIGKKNISHSSYYYLPNKGFYFLAGNKPKKQNLILDTTKNYRWHLIDTSKLILNLQCKLAYHITSSNDTLAAWYTTQIPYGYGFYDFNGLPGVALETISQPMHRHIIATKIEKNDVEIYFPRHLKTYYYQDWKQSFH